MNARWTVSFCCVLGLVLAGCASQYARDDDDRDDDDDEQTVTLDQLPPAVKATLMKESAGGTIAEIDRVSEDGKNMYEADVMLDGKKWEIAILEDGSLSKKKLDTEDDGEDDDDD